MGDRETYMYDEDKQDWYAPNFEDGEALINWELEYLEALENALNHPIHEDTWNVHEYAILTNRDEDAPKGKSTLLIGRSIRSNLIARIPGILSPIGTLMKKMGRLPGIMSPIGTLMKTNMIVRLSG